MTSSRPSFLHRLPWRERTFVLQEIRTETKGGILLLVASTVALVWANSPVADAYDRLREWRVGPSALHLDLSLETWAADGLLAVFFLVAGLELKRELVVGELRSPADALVPVAAALGGMVLPALLYLAVTASRPDLRDGWGVPMATDIAFALAVLAVVAPHVPPALRAFLLTLAVVDDLGAILVIATVYTASVTLWALAGAAALLAVFAVLQHRRVTTGWLTVPLGLAVWVLVHESGVHATVAGVALGLLVRVRPDEGEHESPAQRLEHRLHPWSAYLAVPVFALLAAGVSLTEGEGLATLMTSPLSVAVVVGLVVGKSVGVLGAAYGTAMFTRATLAAGLSWADVAAVAVLSGMGFTVSLLIGTLAFGGAPTLLAEVKIGVLTGSLLSAVLATVLLRRRSAAHRAFSEQPVPEGD